MNRKQGGMSIGIGGVSILAVFVILCLTTLAALAFTSAQADYRLAQKAALSQQQYYEADTRCEYAVADILALAKGNADFEADLAGKGYTVVKGENSAVVTFAVGVSENRNLYAQINLALNQDGVPTGTWEAESWKTQFEETDDAVDEELHVLK